MRNIATWFIIIVSYFIAIVLTIVPLPSAVLWLRPCWVALIVIYWAFALPQRFGVGIAWLMGLLLDLIQGSLLGEQALVLAFIAYLVIKFQKRIYVFTVFQRTLLVFALILFYQVLLFLIQGLMGHAPTTWAFWLSPFTSALFWPWIHAILKAYQRRFKIVDPSVSRMMFSRE
jgi:rod shape-determining protein MreD